MKEFVPDGPITPLVLREASAEVYDMYADKGWLPGYNAIDILRKQRDDAGSIFVDQYPDTSIQEVRTNLIEPQLFPLESDNDASELYFTEAQRAIQAQHLSYDVDLLHGVPQCYGSWRFEGRVAPIEDGLAEKERIADYLTHEEPLAGADGLQLPGAHGDAYRLLGVVSDVMGIDEARAQAAHNDPRDFVTYSRLHKFARWAGLPEPTFRNIVYQVSRSNLLQTRQPNAVADSKAGPVAFDGRVNSRQARQLAFDAVSRDALSTIAEKVCRKGATREFLKMVVAETAPKDT